MHFLSPNLIADPLFGCFITGHSIARLIDYTKDASRLFITISNQVLNNF